LILILFCKGFVRSSQGLEVVALVFYIVAAGLIIVGILNTPGISYELPFLGAAGLLFISSMSKQRIKLK
jgi:hypothetical protein